MKLGLAIALGDQGNHHSQTFIRAINYSLEQFSHFGKLSLKIVNDKKSTTGGQSAAEELIQWGAQVVVGHFSSIAAIAAIPAYIEASVPLLLPAATSCLLEDYQPSLNRIYRYQKNNESLISYCVDAASNRGSGGETYFLIQDNEYGNMMLMHVPALSNVKIIRNLPFKIQKNDVFIIVGYSDFATKIISKLTECQIQKLILIDDADNPEVWKNCLISPLIKSRIRTSTPVYKHSALDPFWNETLLSLSLATFFCMESGINFKSIDSYETYLGVQEFDRFNYYSDSFLIEEKVS